MTFYKFSQKLQAIEGTDSRNAMTEQLADLFAETSVDEIQVVCYLALGRLAPLFDRIEFNLAEKMVMRSVARAFEVEKEAVEKEYKDKGDLGIVVEGLGKKQITNNKKQTVTVAEVYEKLLTVAKEGGEGSQERKVEGLAELLKDLDALSGRYVVRIVLGKLRLGFSDKTILDALSYLAVGDKSGRKKLDAAYQIFPDVGRLAQLVKKHGVSEIDEKVSVTLGVPVLPALAQRLKTPEEMIEKMGTVLVEPKYDGTRVQIHIKKKPKTISQKSKATSQKPKDKNQKSNDGWRVKTFTRNLDETTHMFPELADALEQVQADEAILDSEAVGYDPETGQLLPFQMTITRKRKHGIAGASEEVPLKFFVYDLLYKDGESYVRKPLRERREALELTVSQGEVLELAPHMVTDDPKELEAYHAEQLEKGLEGALVKKLEAPYRSGRRGWSWVKFKEVAESQGKLSDTIDPVVMGFYRGKGKRAKFGIGAFLVGVRGNPKPETRNPKQNEEIPDRLASNDRLAVEDDGSGMDSFPDPSIVTIAKIGTGLTDEQWRQMRQRLEEVVSVDKPKEYIVDESLEPDVWVDPEVVVEVAADEITKSPNHSAGMALRFPRLIKFRDDKDVAQVTTIAELEEIRESS